MGELDAEPTMADLEKAINALASGKAPSNVAIPPEVIKEGNIERKFFARVVFTRLQVLAERVYPEAQCGFQLGRSTIDMVFSVRQLQEKCREQRQPLHLAFVDLTKAFDLVSRSGLFSLLQRIGCPPKLLSLIKSFHTDMKGTVRL
ncbi:uncharacterized protein LOC128549358 [Mercenaria mercenaria]|uniref:uncharacterized protein LOC128549358 n=1 Tax=Mercenaria mercenaria TaxID=6596 RepID=UPI00234E577B|nr:uncharacterized protein LOC128549358 [Mercenaria mercenaria]